DDPDVFNDKESITADSTSDQRVYATWDRLENFTASSGGGDEGDKAKAAAAIAAAVRFEHDKVLVAGRMLRQMRNAALAAAVDPHNGNLYLVWQDNRFTNLGIDQIAFSMSKNNGKTWSLPMKINKTPKVPANRLREAAFVPTVAVNAAGVLAVTYYDFRNDD